MIRFALIAASVLGFALTAALGNLMVPLLRELQRTMRGAQPEQEIDRKEPEEPVPTIGGLCLMVGTLAAVGAGWLAACAAQPSLLGSDRQMMSRLLIALLGTFAFGAVGVADDLACIRSRSALGMRRAPRLALEAAAAALVLGLLALSGCLPAGLVLPGAGYIRFAPAPLLWGALLVALAEAARVADGADGTVCGTAFVAMLGLMMLETQLGWFPLAVFPAALAGALMAFLLWDFPPAKLHPGKCGCLFAAGAIGWHPAVHRLCRAQRPAGAALLAGRRHGGAADPVLPPPGQAAVRGCAAASLAGKARPERGECFLQPVRPERVRAGAGRASSTLGLSALF